MVDLFRWLQLSDLRTSVVRSSERQHLEGEVIVQLREVVARDGSINTIVLTGNLTASGKADELKAVDEFLNKVCEVVGPARIFPVPGRLDVNPPDEDDLSYLALDMLPNPVRASSRYTAASASWLEARVVHRILKLI